MRRATASVIFRTQVVLVYLQYISAKIRGSRSFKVIDVGTPGKRVGSACYDTQQVCVYLQPFSC